MTEFIMKLTFFTAKPKIDSGNRNSGDFHQDIRVSGFTHPDFTTPILEKAKIKLFSWVANHTASNPKSNLSPIEMRGRIWLLDKIEEGRLLVKADKGGAILIMNPRCFNLQVPNPTKQNKRKWLMIHSKPFTLENYSTVTVGGVNYTIFKFFHPLQFITPPNLMKFWKFPTPSYSYPPHLTKSVWNKNYFVLVGDFQAFFKYKKIFKANFTPKRKSMPFWLVLAIYKAVKDPNLPFTYEWFV